MKSRGMKPCWQILLNPLFAPDVLLAVLQLRPISGAKATARQGKARPERTLLQYSRGAAASAQSGGGLTRVKRKLFSVMVEAV